MNRGDLHDPEPQSSRPRRQKASATLWSLRDRKNEWRPAPEVGPDCCAARFPVPAGANGSLLDCTESPSSSHAHLTEGPCDSMMRTAVCQLKRSTPDAKGRTTHTHTHIRADVRAKGHREGNR